MCSACTPSRPLVPLPIKSSPKSKNKPNGIIAAATPKNKTSIYIFLFSILAIFFRKYRTDSVAPIATPTK